MRSNGFTAINEARGEQSVLEKIENYVQSHDVTLNFPIAGAKVTLAPRSLDDEFNVNVKFASGARSSVEGKSLFLVIFQLFN